MGDVYASPKITSRSPWTSLELRIRTATKHGMGIAPNRFADRSDVIVRAFSLISIESSASHSSRSYLRDLVYFLEWDRVDRRRMNIAPRCQLSRTDRVCSVHCMYHSLLCVRVMMEESPLHPSPWSKSAGSKLSSAIIHLGHYRATPHVLPTSLSPLDVGRVAFPRSDSKPDPQHRYSNGDSCHETTSERQYIITRDTPHPRCAHCP